MPTFTEEIVGAYEIGLKTDLADGRVRLNTAAFFYDYEGLQYQATDPEVFEGGVGNIPESEIYGAELELSAFLSDSVILDLRASWLNTKITADHLALDNVESENATNALLGQGIGLFSNAVQIARAGRIQNVKGNELAKTPDFTADISVTYETELPSGNSLTSVFQFVKRGEFMPVSYTHLTLPTTPYV